MSRSRPGHFTLISVFSLHFFKSNLKISTIVFKLATLEILTTRNTYGSFFSHPFPYKGEIKYFACYPQHIQIVCRGLVLCNNNNNNNNRQNQPILTVTMMKKFKSYQDTFLQIHLFGSVVNQVYLPMGKDNLLRTKVFQRKYQFYGDFKHNIKKNSITTWNFLIGLT